MGLFLAVTQFVSLMRHRFTCSTESVYGETPKASCPMPGYGAHPTWLQNSEVCLPAGEATASAKWDSPDGTSRASLIWPV